jgi:hypothetical protein
LNAGIRKKTACDAEHDPCVAIAFDRGEPPREHGERHKRHLHNVGIERPNRKCHRVNANHQKDGDGAVAVAGDAARKQKDEPSSERDGHRPQRVDGKQPAGAEGDFQNPRRERRRVHIAELPFAAERDRDRELRIGRWVGEPRHKRPHGGVNDEQQTDKECRPRT